MKKMKLLSILAPLHRWGILAAFAMALPSVSFGMSADGVVGPPSGKMSDATLRAMRISQDGAPVVQEGHSRFQELTLRKGAYSCADLGATPVATQAGLSLTTPALTLWNPPTSGVNVVINTVSAGYTVLVATAVFMEAVSTGTQVAPITTTNATIVDNLIGNTATPQANCYRVATLNAVPIAVRFPFQASAGAGASGAATGSFVDHVDGEIIIAPGQLFTIQTTAAVTALASFSWEEVAQ